MQTTLTAAVESYLRAKALSRGTRNEYFATLRKWEQWGGGAPIEELRRKEIREFLDWVYEHAVADEGTNPGRTANKARENLRAVISWAWEQELIDAPPRFPKRRPQRDVAGRHYLTKAEINALYFATHKMERPRAWDKLIPIGRYWRSALVVFFNYGLDTGTVWKSAPFHEPILWPAGNPRGGWDATNLMTDKKVRIKSAQRLRCPANRGGSAQEDPEVVEPDVQDDVEDTTNAIPETPDAIETPDTPEADVAPASDVESVSEAPTMDEEATTAKPECPAPLDTVDTAEVATAPVPDAQDVAETPGMAEDATAPIPESENVAETLATTDDAATPAPEVQPAAETPVATEGTAPEAPVATEAPTETKARRPKAEPKPKKISALDAAARVLAENGKPMNCMEMVEEMSRKGYWISPNGATPQATLYSAILREIKVKGTDARFVKAERGKFASAAK